MATLLRSERAERRAPGAALCRRHARAQLGPHRFRIQRIGSADPRGDDPLRRQQDRAARGGDTATIEREFFATARPSSVIKRFTAPAEVAAMIAYVCSTQASATTGAALRVDGGVVRSIA